MNGNALYFVNELKLKIKHLLNPIDYSMNSECGEILKLVYKELVESFEEVAKTSISGGLDLEIVTIVVYHLQVIVDEIHSRSDQSDEEIQNLKEKIHFFTPRLKTMEHKYSDGLYNVSSYLDDEEDDARGAISSEMIGGSEVYEQLIQNVISSQVTSVDGMPGVGKTTLAYKFFEDSRIVEIFDCRVWVRVGKRYRAKDIPRRMLEEMDPDGLQMIPEGDEEAVGEYLKASLKSKRCLVVLDDVWDRFTMAFLYPYQWPETLQPFLHPESNSRILITGRMQQLHGRRKAKDCMITMRLLTKEESWDLLRKKVFAQRLCSQFEKAGKKISENCEGLPLTIVTLARLLTQKEEKSNPEYWDEVAAKNNHQIFMDTYDEISKVLRPSYTYLPPLLKMCFMFIGLFPPKYEVPRSKLFNLWLVDRFVELNVHIHSRLIAHECLEELVSNNLLMVYQKSTYTRSHKIKTCCLHSSLWHMSKKKAKETKFALLLSIRNDGLGDGIEGHHRVSFNNNTLFAIKDVHVSVESTCASTARSLFCFAPYQQYQVPLCFQLKLLRELDALSIRFYEFPMEVLQLVRLTYLSLTSNGVIPDSISQLQFLEFLIVDRHQNIKLSCKEALFLPAEIWSLQKLKHLQVMGSDLPDPHGASLSNLSTLLDVSAHSCTNVVLKGIPNLLNLRIRIELTPDDGKPLICFNTHRISNLCELDKLKCVIVNPDVVLPVAPFSKSPEVSNLTKLSLSGLGYPWKEMKNIASLPRLEVLKLKNYAFQGSEWEVEETGFTYLSSLVIEDTDLVNWRVGYEGFKMLKSLKIKHCYKLKEIHGKFGYGVGLEMIELVDCNPSWVVELKKTINKFSKCVIDVHSSWVDRKRKT